MAFNPILVVVNLSKFEKCLEYEIQLEGHCIPQADKYQTLLNTLHAIQISEVTEKEIAESIIMDHRQGNLYAIACGILGLASFKEMKPAARVWSLTKRGELFLEGGPFLRKEIMTLAVVQVPIVQLVLRLIEKSPDGATDDAIDKLVGSAVKTDDDTISKTTTERRRQTVLCWLQWIGFITKHNDKWRVFYE